MNHAHGERDLDLNLKYQIAYPSLIPTLIFILVVAHNPIPILANGF